MRQLELVRMAAKKHNVDYRTLEKSVKAFLVTAADVVAAGEPVSMWPMGKIHPIEPEQDRRRKWRGIAIRPSTHMVGLLRGSNTHIDLDNLDLGDIIRISR